MPAQSGAALRRICLQEGDKVVDFEAPESLEAHLCARNFSTRACQKLRKFMLVRDKPVFAGFLQGGRVDVVVLDCCPPSHDTLQRGAERTSGVIDNVT